jgi:hypothetical protein|eukprot:COSAG06_NODE_7110_length_2628_cov_39.368921_3_plen_182_part_00
MAQQCRVSQGDEFEVSVDGGGGGGGAGEDEKAQEDGEEGEDEEEQEHQLEPESEPEPEPEPEVGHHHHHQQQQREETEAEVEAAVSSEEEFSDSEWEEARAGCVRCLQQREREMQIDRLLLAGLLFIVLSWFTMLMSSSCHDAHAIADLIGLACLRVLDLMSCCAATRWRRLGTATVTGRR